MADLKTVGAIIFIKALHLYSSRNSLSSLELWCDSSSGHYLPGKKYDIRSSLTFFRFSCPKNFKESPPPPDRPTANQSQRVSLEAAARIPKRP